MKSAMVMRAFLLTAVSLGTALAEPTIDFLVNSPTGGAISYAGGSAPLVGSGIDIDGAVGIYGTPANNNTTFRCFSCFMSFSTGALQSMASAPSTSQYTFGQGGSIALVGSVDTNNNNILDAGDVGGLAGTTLFSGYFGGASPVVVNFSGSGFNVLAAAFTAFVDPNLAGTFGLAPQPNGFTGNLNLSFFSQATSGGGFASSGVGSGNVFASAPEPGSLVLMGTALIGCGLLGRRIRKA